MNRPWQLPFHRVLHRPVLLRQGEREPMLIVLLMAGLLASRMNVICGAAAAVVFLTGVPACRYLAKRDPQFHAVLRRARRYHPFYPARSRPYRRDPVPMTPLRRALWCAAGLAAIAGGLWVLG